MLRHHENLYKTINITYHGKYTLNEQVVYVMDRLPLAEEMSSFRSLVLARTHPLHPMLAIGKYHGRKPWYKYCGVQG